MVVGGEPDEYQGAAPPERAICLLEGLGGDGQRNRRIGAAEGFDRGGGVLLAGVTV